MKITRYLLLIAPLMLASPAFAQEAPTPPEGMVYVPAGEFTMGTDNADRSDFNQRDNVPLQVNDARPQHRATTGAFFIDATEVTNAQYQKYCEATGAVKPPHWKEGEFATGEADFPVHHVNWYEAVAYAKWMNKRLPTEAEWEKAARGTDGRLFPWGNEWDANKANTSSTRPRAVGQYPDGASVYGALDMLGNVAEWTSSWWEAYPGSPTKQPEFGRHFRVARGGAWSGSIALRQTWHRAIARPQARIEWIGFRCVRDVD